MKSKFSNEWNSSKQPRKQRKFRANAPLHVKGKFLTATLSKDLRKKFGRRNLRLKAGDKVKVMRGRFRGETGDVSGIDLKRTKVYISDIQINRRDGSKSQPSFRPSNLMITEVDKEDAKRMAKLGQPAEKKETAEEKKSGSKESKAEKPEVKKESGPKKKESKGSGSKKSTKSSSTGDKK